MACNFYNPSKGICMAKFEKYGKEDLAIMQWFSKSEYYIYKNMVENT